MANGVRHLIWDFAVVGFTIKEVFLSHKIVLAFALVLFLRLIGLAVFG
jgi:succinate dehydrogenase/fumarate reductase cytochrome b subunit